MSAANFIQIFKNMRKSISEKSDFDVYKKWVDSNKTWFNKNRDELVAAGLSKNVDFLFTEDRARILGVTAEFNNLIKSINNRQLDGPVVEMINGKPAVLFPNIAFKGGIERTLDKYFGGGTFAKSRELNYVKGHVYGLMTGAIVGATEDLQNTLVGKGVSQVPIFEQNAADAALNFLDILIDHLTILDEESSDIKTMDSKLRVKYRKKATSFLVELQLESDNSESARLVQALAGRKGGNTGIRGLINPGASQEKILTDLLGQLRKEAKFSNKEIADFESSPSWKSLVIDSVVNILKGKKSTGRVYQQTVDMPDKVVTTFVDEEGKKAYRAKLKQLKQEAQRSKAKLQRNKSKLHTTIPINSTASLEAILRSRLALQIRKNMGTGNARNVLNYRTGRFAESASIERTTTSRAGMISVFYSYMRNPYGTFSDGGAQQFPKTRDPNLLISKSIREIGASLVGTRLRAVLV